MRDVVKLWTRIPLAIGWVWCAARMEAISIRVGNTRAGWEAGLLSAFAMIYAFACIDEFLKEVRRRNSQ